jgi:CMP-N,N'-diacetyllegionaminic acid synthase
MKQSNIHAVFPVRAGSKRVVNKNIRPFAGSTLIEIKVRQLLACKGLSGVYVSSESEEMLGLAEKAGAIPLLREAAYATDDIPMSDVYAHIAGQMPEGDILFTHATNPICGTDSFSRCIETYRGLPAEFDSLTTVRAVKDFLYLDGKALNFDPACKPRSQDLPAIVKLTHAVSILPRSLMIECKNIMGSNPFFLHQSDEESIDIDTEMDFHIAEFVYNGIAFGSLAG